MGNPQKYQSLNGSMLCSFVSRNLPGTVKNLLNHIQTVTNEMGGAVLRLEQLVPYFHYHLCVDTELKKDINQYSLGCVFDTMFLVREHIFGSRNIWHVFPSHNIFLLQSVFLGFLDPCVRA